MHTGRKASCRGESAGLVRGDAVVRRRALEHGVDGAQAVAVLDLDGVRELLVEGAAVRDPAERRASEKCAGACQLGVAQPRRGALLGLLVADFVRGDQVEEPDLAEPQLEEEEPVAEVPSLSAPPQAA